jgi:hypothetical protein
MWYGKIIVRTLGIPVENSGKRSVYLMTSGGFGGNGVEGVLTTKKTVLGALFCVDDKLVGLHQEKFMAELRSRDAGSMVWDRLMKVLGPHL